MVRSLSFLLKRQIQGRKKKRSGERFTFRMWRRGGEPGGGRGPRVGAAPSCRELSSGYETRIREVKEMGGAKV